MSTVCICFILLAQFLATNQVEINPNIPSQDISNAFITLNPSAWIDDSNYKVRVQSQDAFDIKLSLDNSYGFHPSLISTITLSINGETPFDPFPNQDTDFLIVFSVGDLQYFSLFLHLDSTNHKTKIYPSISSEKNIQNVSEWIYNTTKYSQRWDRISNNKQWISLNFTKQALWPLQFEIATIPNQQQTLFTFYHNSSYTPTIRYTFKAIFAPNKNMDIYIMGDSRNEEFTIKSFNILLINQPTISPTTNPTPEPTPKPSRIPSQTPTIPPTPEPTAKPTFPTYNPTYYPSLQPTETPTNYPSIFPTLQPTNLPTLSPTDSPSKDPSQTPSIDPTILPSKYPTDSPSSDPSKDPTISPTKSPSSDPSKTPTYSPTKDPSVSHIPQPTIYPTYKPTNLPTQSSYSSSNDDSNDGYHSMDNINTIKPTNFEIISNTKLLITTLSNTELLIANSATNSEQIEQTSFSDTNVYEFDKIYQLNYTNKVEYVFLFTTILGGLFFILLIGICCTIRKYKQKHNINMPVRVASNLPSPPPRIKPEIILHHTTLSTIGENYEEEEEASDLYKDPCIFEYEINKGDIESIENETKSIEIQFLKSDSTYVDYVDYVD